MRLPRGARMSGCTRPGLGLGCSGLAFWAGVGVGVMAGSGPRNAGKGSPGGGGERHEQRRGSGGEGRADPPCPGLPPQRLYSMDLRSSHKAKGKEKLCFSLTRPLGSGSPEGVVKAGAPELVDKGPLVPTLPFPLRKPRKAHKYLRLSRKKFPPRGPDLESHSHPRELFLQEPAAPDVLQAASEWEPAEQPPEEEGKVARPRGPVPEPLRAGKSPRVIRFSCRKAPRGPGSAWSPSSRGPTVGELVQAGKINVVASSRVSSLELGPDLAADVEGDPVLGWRGSACRLPLPPFLRCRQRCPPSLCLSLPWLPQMQTWPRGPLLGLPCSPRAK